MPENVCIRCGGALVDTGIFCPACRAEEDRKTDDARLERLTVLARKVCRNDTAQAYADRLNASVTIEVGGSRCRVFTVEGHPRALDALEAALLVLDMSPERAARLLHGMRTYRECPCVRCERDSALASEKKC